MAIYKIFPTKDTTLYTEFPNMNTGLDSILDCSTYIKDDQPLVCRSLIQFSTDEINDVIGTMIGTSSYDVFLRGYSAILNGLNSTSTLEVYPLYEEWNMGTGHFKDNKEISNGASWNYRNSLGVNSWITSSYPLGVTGSFQPTLKGGGSWYTNYKCTQSFTYANILDLNLNVSNIVNGWYNGDISSSGFILKQPDTDEFNNNYEFCTTFKFFSIDTHTIYPPCLEFRWEDYSLTTGSKEIIPTLESFISINNNTGTYYSNSIEKFRLMVSPKYPNRIFQTSSLYTKKYYLPLSESYYAIKDSETNEYVIDFDDTFTKISADDESSYFTLYMAGLEPERYYTVLIKSKQDGVVKIFDEGLMFKVSN